MLVHFSVMFLLCILNVLPKTNARITYKYSLFVSFIIIFIYAAFRYNYGPDYTNYLEMFKKINYGVQVRNVELGFVFFMSLFSKYYMMIFVTSLFMSLSFFYFIKKYINEKYYWLVILFLFLETSLLLNNFVAMRSAICVYLFLLSFKYLESRRFFVFAFFVFFSSLFHTSSILLIFLYLLHYISFNSKHYYFWIVFFVLSLLVGSYLSKYVFLLTISLSDELSRYAFYLDKLQTRNIFGMLSQIPYIFVGTLLIKKLSFESDSIKKMIVNISLIFILINLLQLDPMGRFSMYLWPFYLVSITQVYGNIKQVIFKVSFVIMLLFQSSISLLQLYTAEYGVSFLEYKTIFGARVLP